MFLINPIQDSGESYEPDKVLSIVDAALAQLHTERQWDRNNINVETQIQEASFIFRRVIQSINQLGAS